MDMASADALEKGCIMLSCGCRHEDSMGGIDTLHVRYRTESCDPVDGFANAVAYGVWCPSCRTMLEQEGLLIRSDEEELEWLDGKAA